MREQLLRHSLVPWGEVAESVVRSNQLLFDCPDRRLSRIARPANLPLSTPLTDEDKYVYVVISGGLPYVGRVGRKKPRAPIKRFQEHHRRARVLKNMFFGAGHRCFCSQLGFGKTLSIVLLIARVGGPYFSMLLIDRPTPQCVNRRGFLFHSVLQPMADQICPVGGLHRLRWEYALLVNTHQVGSAEATATKAPKTQVNGAIMKLASGQIVEPLLLLLAGSIGKAPATLHDRLFEKA